ncbi:MAG: hypothetical protein DRR16_13695 [Candidatus Parabeggiatoa sp. nov. 3]|jgi:hypothetical protein|nr:MAG: hypothetical protein DRR00_00045 [Gammaproteobacteria bacterium]RKZ65268.1 MAG: hypothetical protein DRQ99_13180 [Gammaproteobacteria bacterium]RKZ84791.1 MAG: hypothetical protein DRR16_13695 [Gammaproteobacteria bacterium]
MKLSSEQRKKLLAKREQLQRKIAQNEQAFFIQELLFEFDSNAIEYEIVWPDYKTSEVKISKWLREKFSITSWGRIDSHHITMIKKCEVISSCEKLLGEIIEKQRLGNPVVTLIWTNAHRPGIQLKLCDVVKNVEIIFEQDWDTWIVCSENQWCIEYHHDGELSYGSCV